MAITWRDVAAPELGSSARMLDNGAQSLVNAFSSLNKAFDPIRDARQFQQNEAIKNNTNLELDRINQIQDVNTLRQLIPTLSRDAITQRYGAGNVDVDKIMSVAMNAEKNLTDRLTSQFNYDQARLKQADTPVFNALNEDLNSYTTSKDMLPALDSLRERAKSLNDGGSTMAAINARYESLVKAEQDKKDEAFDRERKIYEFNYNKNQNALQEKKDNEEAKYNSLYNLLVQSHQQGASQADLNRMVMSSGLPEQMQSALVNTARSFVSGNSTFLDADEQLSLAKTKSAGEADIQAQDQLFQNETVIPRENSIKERIASYGGTIDNVKEMNLDSVDFKGNMDKSGWISFIGRIAGKDVVLDAKDIEEITTHATKIANEAKTLIAADYFEKGTPKAGALKKDFGFNDKDIDKISKLSEEEQKTFIANKLAITEDVMFNAMQGRFSAPRWGLNADVDAATPNDIVAAYKGKQILKNDIATLKKLKEDKTSDLNSKRADLEEGIRSSVQKFSRN